MTRRKPDAPAESPSALRQRAEARLQANPETTASLDDPRRLVHELQVHQLELEMQNEELVRAKVELETALQRYSNLCDFAPVGYMTLERDGTIREANLTAASMLETVRSRLVGQSLGRFLSDGTRPALMEMLRSGSEHASESSCEAEVRSQEPAPRQMQVSASTQDGQLYRVAMTDVTERKRLEGDLRMAQKMESVGRLAGGVAHEFNNLLTAILGFSGFALDALEEGHPARVDILDIKVAGERAAALTKKLLAFSRKQVLHAEPLDPNAVTLGLRRMLVSMLGERIRLQTTLAPDLAVIVADAVQLEQVLVNLALNARDAMPDGGVLEVRTMNVEVTNEQARRLGITPGPYGSIAVADTGCGMDEESRAHLFEPFFTTKAKGAGTGLGLATVLGIVKQSRGHVAVRSEAGQGTTFELYFPAKPGEAIPAADIAPVSTGAKGTETILVVEDDAALRRVAERTLTEAGFHVIPASGGVEALQLWETGRGAIQLVLTDVMMPEMTGTELAARLAAVQPGLKVLFMSGFVGEASAELGRGPRFIAKPFTPSQLTRKVRDVLDELVPHRRTT